MMERRLWVQAGSAARMRGTLASRPGMRAGSTARMEGCSLGASAEAIWVAGCTSGTTAVARGCKSRVAQHRWCRPHARRKMRAQAHARVSDSSLQSQPCYRVSAMNTSKEDSEIGTNSRYTHT